MSDVEGRRSCLITIFFLAFEFPIPNQITAARPPVQLAEYKKTQPRYSPSLGRSFGRISILSSERARRVSVLKFVSETRSDVRPVLEDQVLESIG